MRYIKRNWLQLFVAFSCGIFACMMFTGVCVKNATSELMKQNECLREDLEKATQVNHRLTIFANRVEDQRNILSDVIRCHSDEEVENCDIMDVAKDFLPTIGCSKDSLAEWSYCY